MNVEITAYYSVNDDRILLFVETTLKMANVGTTLNR